ncbi:MAG: phosphatidylglycerophosphatase A [Phycisphaerae bacterium]|nr:phosphatidylglycerophosphatase A [Phycisphaerae bacterium]
MRRLIITFFGSGYLPVAPGTWGSAAACLCFLALYLVIPDASYWNVITAVGVLAASITSVALGRWAVKHFGKSDPGQFVLDEVAGQWLAMLALPLADLRTTIAALVFQFFAFRVLDIIKPPPARQLERLPDGWGILLDDLASGIYANVIGQVFFRLVWPHLA